MENQQTLCRFVGKISTKERRFTERSPRRKENLSSSGRGVVCPCCCRTRARLQRPWLSQQEHGQGCPSSGDSVRWSTLRRLITLRADLDLPGEGVEEASSAALPGEEVCAAAAAPKMPSLLAQAALLSCRPGAGFCCSLPFSEPAGFSGWLQPLPDRSSAGPSAGSHGKLLDSSDSQGTLDMSPQ